MILNGIVLCFDYINHLNIFVSYTLDLITLYNIRATKKCIPKR